MPVRLAMKISAWCECGGRRIKAAITNRGGGVSFAEAGLAGRCEEGGEELLTGTDVREGDGCGSGRHG
jgi:hypothetical protein